MVYLMYVNFLILIEHYVSKSGYPDQKPRSAASGQNAASGLGLHCLPLSHKKHARFIYFNEDKVLTPKAPITTKVVCFPWLLNVLEAVLRNIVDPETQSCIAIHQGTFPYKSDLKFAP